MALTFTGSLSVATAGHQEIQEMLVGAIGCNIAWGLIDAVMFLVTRLAERAHERNALLSLRQTASTEEAARLLADRLPSVVNQVMKDSELHSMLARIKALPEPPPMQNFERLDLIGAVYVFFIVVLSTFPVVLPFILMSEVASALRVSNAIAVIMLFLCGHQLGMHAKRFPMRMGFLMAVIGSILVALTIMLGG